MSVDTYARKTRPDAYLRVRQDGVEVLVAKALTTTAEFVRVELRRFLFWRSLAVRARLLGHPT